MTALYGVRQLVDGIRAVRQNTVRMAEEIPESRYDYRPTPQSRSVAETLVHIAWLWTADHLMHAERRLESLDGFDFPALLAMSAAEEQRTRAKAEIVDLLRTDGERWAAWVAQLSEAFLAERVRLPDGSSVNRFEMLLGTKEHEMQHRAQLTVIERLLGIAPRPTGLA